MEKAASKDLQNRPEKCPQNRLPQIRGPQIRGPQKNSPQLFVQKVASAFYIDFFSPRQIPKSELLGIVPSFSVLLLLWRRMVCLCDVVLLIMVLLPYNMTWSTTYSLGLISHPSFSTIMRGGGHNNSNGGFGTIYRWTDALTARRCLIVLHYSSSTALQHYKMYTTLNRALEH